MLNYMQCSLVMPSDRYRKGLVFWCEMGLVVVAT